MVKITISHGLGDAKDESGRTLLHYSAKKGQEDLTKLLIRQGCDVDARDNEGTTPLMLAVLEYNAEIVEILLKAKADVYVEDNLGKNVLQMAFAVSIVEHKSLVHLLKRVEMTMVTADEISAQLMRYGCPLYRAVLLKNPTVIGRMIEKGANVEMKDPHTGYTALFRAALHDDIETVKMLLNHNANVNTLDNVGNNIAAKLQECCLEMLTILVDRGMTLTTTSSFGLFQVWNILLQGDRQLVNFVLRTNIDFTAKDKYQQTLINYLVDNANPGVMDELKDHIHKFDVNAYSVYGTCPLLEAVQADNYEAVRLLLESGAQVNCADRITGETPLHHCFPIESNKNAPGNRYDECLETLLQSDADPQIVTKAGCTIFKAAQDCGQYKRLQLVIAHLAMLQRHGTPLSDLTMSAINSHQRFKQYFDSCRRILRFNFYGSTDLFLLLTADAAALASHLRQEKCLRKFILFSENSKVKTCYKYYNRTLKQRIARVLSSYDFSCQCPSKDFKDLKISELFVMKEKILARHLRCAKCLCDIMPIFYNAIHVNICSALKKRILSIIYKTTLMDSAAVGLSKIFQGRINKGHLVLNKILDYLDDESLKSLSSLRQKGNAISQ